MMKPGDLIHQYKSEDLTNTDHIMVVVGIAEDGVYIAENGKNTQKILYTTFMNGERTYQIVLLENYYNNPNNQNNLYN